MLWVPERALGTVTTRAATFRFRDATSTTVAAGVAVRLQKAIGRGYGMYDVWTHDLTFATPIRHADVGASYAPSPSFDDRRAEHFIVEGAELRFGGTGRVSRRHRYVYLPA
ncbi:MAG: hypothetical protein RIT45_554 [Pseudomonadota bacterium]